MKTKIAFLSVVISFALIRMFGQSVPDEVTTPNPGNAIYASPPPTYETSTEGMDIKVWVMTSEEHKKMMEGTNNQMSTSDKKEGKMKDKNMSKNATHHIKVEITDAENGQARNGLSTRVQVTSPSKKIWWIDLRNMSNHYGNDLTLNEKGPYMFTINFDDNGFPRSTQFEYKVE
jgi:hypothetical protein